MKTVHVKSLVKATTYKGLISEAEKKLSNFFEIELEEVKDKLNYEITVYESSDDGVSLPIFTGELSARLRNTHD
jgi:uncharacterized membrane protein YkoI